MSIVTQLLGIGLDSKDLSVLQVCSRGTLIFFYCIFLVRLADKRFLSRKTALDAVLGFILASMMARAVNGSSPLAPTLAAGLLLVLLHRLLARATLRWHALGGWIKGAADLVIENGCPVQKALRKNDFSEADMMEDLRLAGVESPADVQSAHIERNGRMSVIKRPA
jgi:uncharacterized membrane protein YcaP (DUF421 family)